MFILDFFNYLQNDILVKTDRMGTKRSKIRAPFLDETIVNFSMKLSSKIKFNKNNLKVFSRV